MFTLKHFDNFSKYYQHATWLQVEGQTHPKLSGALSNQFALHEERIYQEETDPRFANWLTSNLYNTNSPIYRLFCRLTTAHLTGLQVTIYTTTNSTHGQILLHALNTFASVCSITPTPQHAPTNTHPLPALEPVADYINDNDPFADHFHMDPVEDLYTPIPAPRLQADDYDINLFQIVWVLGKNASMLAYALDDHSALVPSFGCVPLKPRKFRFARHAVGKMPHLQSALAQAYNAYYSVKDCDWDIDPEMIESNYNTELGSRYETDTDPNNEDNYNHDNAINYLALAAYDTYTGGTVAPTQRGHLVPAEQWHHAQPVYTQRPYQFPKMRTVTDQKNNKFRRIPRHA